MPVPYQYDKHLEVVNLADILEMYVARGCIEEFSTRVLIQQL